MFIYHMALCLGVTTDTYISTRLKHSIGADECLTR